MRTIETTTRQFPIAQLVLDGTVQLRANLNRNAILDYAEAMQRGDEFPPIVVFHRAGGPAYVGDGFHRVLAAKHLKRKTILAEVRDGTKRDAILFSARANTKHGVRRTNEDKRKAVITLLKDKEWTKWANTEIARACAVDATTVAKYRDWLRPEKAASHEEVRSYIDRAGRERTRVVPLPPDDVGDKVRLRKCPYCGQAMSGGPVNPNRN